MRCTGRSLMIWCRCIRDAYIGWDEQRQLDWVIRYWEKARRRGCRCLPTSGLLPRLRVDGRAAPDQGARHLRAPVPPGRQERLSQGHAAGDGLPAPGVRALHRPQSRCSGCSTSSKTSRPRTRRTPSWIERLASADVSSRHRADALIACSHDPGRGPRRAHAPAHRPHAQVPAAGRAASRSSNGTSKARARRRAATWSSIMPGSASRSRAAWVAASASGCRIRYSAEGQALETAGGHRQGAAAAGKRPVPGGQCRHLHRPRLRGAASLARPRSQRTCWPIWSWWTIPSTTRTAISPGVRNASATRARTADFLGHRRLRRRRCSPALRSGAHAPRSPRLLRAAMREGRVQRRATDRPVDRCWNARSAWPQLDAMVRNARRRSATSKVMIMLYRARAVRRARRRRVARVPRRQRLRDADLARRASIR